MTSYVVTFEELSSPEGLDEGSAHLRARIHSPDLDYDSPGYTYIQVPAHLLNASNQDDQRLLCAAVAAVALEESRGGEQTDDAFLPWLNYLYFDFENVEPAHTSSEVIVQRLDGRCVKFEWEDRTSVDAMSQMWDAWKRRKALLDQDDVGVDDLPPKRGLRM